MSDGIFVALSGAVAQERSLEVVANNVANVGTAGFRADRLTFAESLSRASTGAAAGGPVPDSLRYVTVDAERIDPASGPLRETGNPLDLAISGDDCYFAVSTENGDRFTRDGSFTVASDGVVRTRSGDALLDASPPDPAHPELRIPPGSTSISVAPDGTLSAGDAVVGRVRIVRLPPESLHHEGASLLVARGASPVLAADATVTSGWLEGANVSPIHGMNELVAVTRSFEAFQRVIQGFRDLDTRTARDLAGS